MPDFQKRVERAIAEKVFPGCVIGIVDRDGRQLVMPFGHFTYDAGSPEVREDTIYDVASVTKSIPVASLILQFAAEGKLSLTDKVSTYVPELQNHFDATIEDLLRYRVRGSRLSNLQHKTFEEIRTHILENGFEGPPAESQYTNLPAFILGLVVERVGGNILPALADEYFFKPLGMSDTTFFPHDSARTAPTEIVGGEEIRGIVHDESARKFARARRAVGHAGLFSTAPDILAFLDVLISGDFPAIASGAKKGLGWHLEQEWFMGANPPKGTFGKTGFTGTSIVCDIRKRVGLVILSNRTYPQRPTDATSFTSAINTFRSDIADLLFR